MRSPSSTTGLAGARGLASPVSVEEAGRNLQFAGRSALATSAGQDVVVRAPPRVRCRTAARRAGAGDTDCGEHRHDPHANRPDISGEPRVVGDHVKEHEAEQYGQRDDHDRPPDGVSDREPDLAPELDHAPNGTAVSAGRWFARPGQWQELRNTYALHAALKRPQSRRAPSALRRQVCARLRMAVCRTAVGT